MRTFIAALVLSAGSVASVTSAYAGEVLVKFADPAGFADFGFGALERERNQAELAAFIQSLAGRFPTSQALKIEILDVNLAGEEDPLWRRGQGARILRDVTIPRIQLRYEWREGSQVLGGGTVDLKDLNYLYARGDSLKGATLEHEKRLLERWFQATFVASGRR
ncbi:DUF3016 domain-containing protein [Inhella gelatinilytica]|uniref:DUF3016 domain-containing protein n=1 Tax=Inhella gelatinilytica TaxID=2795030 RepID=A0A931J1R8_9BURK|nr:DUF3016 domain-containing protein [Inhella gelatinilytica]MBH9553771.1 DUF3016 domain-containing protein [Inhella gelatinilytica]